MKRVVNSTYIYIYLSKSHKKKTQGDRVDGRRQKKGDRVDVRNR